MLCDRLETDGRTEHLLCVLATVLADHQIGSATSTWRSTSCSPDPSRRRHDAPLTDWTASTSRAGRRCRTGRRWRSWWWEGSCWVWGRSLRRPSCWAVDRTSRNRRGPRPLSCNTTYTGISREWNQPSLHSSASRYINYRFETQRIFN